MDKEIIINGVNVAGCEHFKYDEIKKPICKSGGCTRVYKSCLCAGNADCDYKQLQQLKAENERKQEMIDRQWKLLEQCGVSAGGELKRVSYLLENLRQENERLKENDCEKCYHLDMYIKYKSCLQEIKAIVCGNYEIIDPQGRKDIIKLITKAEEG